MTYEEIKNQINNIQIDFPETGRYLIRALDLMANAEWCQELEDSVVFGDWDGLELGGEIEEDTLLWQDIRDLQHDIAQISK